ncbi:hypothetical protein EUA06_11220 [Nocardioides glacieisoli]|uniref:Uncharacterized protein n=1 Tax=Nocardioides glacieisoli TaxID=1168730 RepID=A0A4Q2RST7_9ACTN|nr:hypothetical protein [Nocardioides glacieisoli]RYB90839.1 hypothetical protein EUA06_11220 [Nocardioides glacieisoli]
MAAVVRAAECWAVDGDELEERLRTEVMALSRANKREEDAEYVARIRTGARYYDRRQPKAEIEAEFWDWVRGDQPTVQNYTVDATRGAA